MVAHIEPTVVMVCMVAAATMYAGEQRVLVHPRSMHEGSRGRGGERILWNIVVLFSRGVVAQSVSDQD